MKKKVIWGLVLLAAALLAGALAWPRLFPEKGTFEDLVLAKCGISGEDITKIETGFGRYEMYDIRDPEDISLFIDYFSRGTYTYISDKYYDRDYSKHYFQVGAAKKSVYIYFYIARDGGNTLVLSWQGKAAGQALYQADFDISISGMMDTMGLEYSGLGGY